MTGRPRGLGAEATRTSTGGINSVGRKCAIVEDVKCEDMLKGAVKTWSEKDIPLRITAVLFFEIGSTVHHRMSQKPGIAGSTQLGGGSR